MSEYIRFGISTFLIIIGLFITLSGIIGFYKFKFILNRMHAAALIDTLGLLFIALGLVVAKGFFNENGNVDMTSVKIILVVVFLWMTSPISSHIISKLIYLTDSNTDKESVEIDVDENKESKDNE